MSYINLNVRSCYSLLGSTIQIEDLIDDALMRKMKFVSLIEDGSMHSAIKFYKACQLAGLQSIIGVSLAVKIGEASCKWTLFARHQKGYRVLLKLTSDLALNGVLPVEEVLLHSENLVICMNVEDIRQTLPFQYPKHFYLAIHCVSSLERAKSLSEMGLPFVFLHEVRALDESDIPVLKVLTAIKNNVKISQVNISENTEPITISTAKLMAASDSFLKVAMENSVKIAELCAIELDLKRHLLPKFEVPHGKDATDYLRALCTKGAKRRYGELTKVHHERLTYELDIIGRMGFSDYFLIVWDFVKYAKINGILVGPGRGSAAGSMVAYVLGITGVDPIEYELLFERFLNPERISLPDIDIDFQDDRRDEVIEYVRAKYGNFTVCQIGTFGTFASRSSWRDTARVHGLETAGINAVTKYLTSKLSLADNLKENAALQKYLESHPTQQSVYMLATRIEGLPRHMSTHAAGVIISPADLRNFTALEKGSTDVYLSQYEAVDLETIGLLKMDFLGLRNLTMIQEISSLIQTEIDENFNIGKIPLDDQKTFELISKADTTGVFQLESGGMRATLRQVLPSDIEDIISVLALFRPGPMANIPMFAARKHGKEHIIYDHQTLKPILENTYGVIVYQEQIMQIANLVAGYSLGEADILRRAISKKENRVMKEEGTKFTLRAKKRGYDEQVAKKIFELILRFANYGFPRSHAASYAMISYQMAYLKANFPQYFMTSVLVTQMGSAKGTAAAIKEARNLGITVLPPSVNDSFKGYHVKNGAIRLGFLSIKHIGVEMANKLITERNKGEFKTFFDFVMRTTPFLGEKIYAALIDVGACDDFGYKREALHENVTRIQDFLKYDGGLFGSEFEMVLAQSRKQQSNLMEREYELLGFYMQTHPIQMFVDMIKANNWLMPFEINPAQHRRICCVGFVARIREIRDKNENLMAFVELSDDVGQIDVTIFAREYTTEYRSLSNKVIVIEGNISLRNDRVSLSFNRLQAVLT